ncbi:MAG: DUF11 domain-containing protein [Verrucomicrobia bacterium]|nr:DUF11 domain-containing protein [Verrucomicrobiota bacterium]
MKLAPASILANSNFSYTISVTNLGPSDAVGVVVTDALPVGVTFVSADSSGTTNGGVVTWNLGTMTVLQATNLTLTVTAPVTGMTLTNVAGVMSPTGDPNPTNNVTPPVTTDVSPSADVSITKSGPAGVQFGATYAYTLTVSNGGPSTATSLSVTDTLPAGVVFVSSVPSTTTNASSQVIWNLGNVAANVTSNLTLTVKAVTRTTATNIATGGSPTFDPNPANNTSAPVFTSITNRPPLAVNDSGSTAKNVAVTIPVLVNDSDPDGDALTIISVSPTNGTANIVGMNVVFTPTGGFTGTATVGYSITDGFGGTNSALITITVTNHVPVANGQSVATTFNTAKAITLTGSDADGDALTFIIVGTPSGGTLSLLDTNTGAVTYTPTNNFSGVDSFTFRVNDGTADSATATVTVTVSAPTVADLAVFKTGPASAVAGSNLVYTITVTNIGPDIATNVLVSDHLPAGYIFVTANPMISLANSNTVIWAPFNLAPHTKTNYTITAKSLEGGTYTNIATATSFALDPNPTNNDGTLTNSQVRTVVFALADVAVFKDGGTNTPAGGTVTYTITATNSGPSTATNVVVKDILPAGTTFQNASGSPTLSNNVVIWPAMVLTNGASVNFTLALTAPGSGSFTNIALGTSDTGDPNPTNNNGTLSQSRVATKVVASADLIVLLNGPTNAVQGSNFVYSIIVSNAGPSVASNAIASDLLPTNLVFVSATGGGTVSNGLVTWPKVAALASGGKTNYSITVYSPLVGVFTNSASGVSTTFDPNPTNNTGVLPASQVRTTVSIAQFNWIIGTPVLNPQTGLYEETVIITNTGSGTVAGFQVYVTILTPNVYLWNATGTNGAGPYVQYNSPVDPSNHVSMILEFYDPLRVPFTNTLRVVPIIPAASGNVGTNGSVAISNEFTDTRSGTTRFVIEFASVPGKTYTIIYSPDMVNWKVATPSVTASANVTQWYDDGPPKTESVPASIPSRFYRVIKN